MLNSLHIENIAVIKSVDIDFESGFSALTGETGAGKSIIIDSINLLLGKKVEKELIRKDEDHAMVSGLFSDLSESTLKVIYDYGIKMDDDGSILIQRTISKDGKSQIKINGRTVSLSLLKDITSALVNIHGQSDTHALVSSEHHLQILDMFVDNAELVKEYSVLYTEYESIKKEIRNIIEKEQERIRYAEILEYQLKDIDALELKDGEEEELIDKKIKIKNSERIIKHTGFVFKALKGSEKGSVSYLLDRCAGALTSLSDVIPRFADYSEKIREFLYQIDDIAEEVYSSVEDMEDDPTEKLNAIESRLDKISKIKRKYGLTIADVLAFREKAADELDKCKNSDEHLKKLNAKLSECYKKAIALADIIHKNRKEGALLLERSVCETLEFLDMPKVVFIIDIRTKKNGEEYELSQYGYDSVEFLISANRGLEPKSIAKIASGGELARIMLALKSVIADKDGIQTIVFDEIDAGVSGKTARKIGIKMQDLSRSIQLFCVTHSAQIASLSDYHFLISKNNDLGDVETSIDLLDENGRINELSRILGGIDITDSQRAAAIDMLSERETYKSK